MASSLSRTAHTRKHVVETKGGVVASQHRLAAEAGAEVLRAGGDAVDAAIATSFVVGVLEPWMSGPAGGGAMMLWRAGEEKAVAVNHGMRSPKGLRVEDYPLSGRGVAGDLFPWEHVTGDVNVQGAKAIAVPGVVDGLGQVHEAYGRMPWSDLLAPAIAHARQGMLVDWYAALVIASTTRALAEDADAAALFLEDGQWPTISGWTALAEKRLDQASMAASLDIIARDGARALYDGDLGAALAKDVQDKGGYLSHDDLRSYRASMQKPLSISYRDARFHLVDGLTAGPTFAHAMGDLEGRDLSAKPDAFAAYAEALNGAYAARLGTMGDTGESPEAPGCTTHFSVVDREGNMVSQTQTLLSIFGSRVVSPSTGFLMNNGIMWFDPVQGRPNSLGPDKRCLMNVCPVLGEQGDRRFAFGASGGRKIVSAMTQMASFVTDFGMDIEEAFHHPRIDVSGGPKVVADEAHGNDVLARLREGNDVALAPRTVFPFAFACPAGVMRKGDTNTGCTEIMSPWGDAALEEED
ncbi:gamma-glutamyltransferase 1 Threonine peptidase. MEROPS family T03 [Roseovarius nanhaiticus]|uniref:Gamma-glutamyltransferase 1 Threonine peptidase. MEROPS family T03 n=1 Tax=Roseovarius nanhaiticus TaxID=573024 RepID=A0A1N7HLW5_9RHOB|nr:gamma-glutamyltransferase [Roseovarius nanhaiticus]SEL27913.1 gamma-glutamyltransferase 1 Threonine peptidase. MEROPS family T03 [Roseovarius nanhaiticus]SIS25670.1 gamma-glutamyltransferase 1 Threonine peptidase. MEROPS family T03 [Roseovarius nanhaiticus]